MEVRFSPEQEPHTSPRGQGHSHCGALLSGDVGDGGSGGTRQGPGSLRLHHRAERDQYPALKKQEIQRHSIEIQSFLTKAQQSSPRGHASLHQNGFGLLLVHTG